MNVLCKTVIIVLCYGYDYGLLTQYILNILFTEIGPHKSKLSKIELLNSGLNNCRFLISGKTPGGSEFQSPGVETEFANLFNLDLDIF